jgi:hypothetical protein
MFPRSHGNIFLFKKREKSEEIKREYDGVQFNPTLKYRSY